MNLPKTNRLISKSVWSSARRMYESHARPSVARICQQLKIPESQLRNTAAAEGWERFTTEAAKAKAVGGTMIWPPLPGSKPVPFEELPPGRCKLILNDPGPGRMNTAMTCAVPIAPENVCYCKEHGHLDPGRKNQQLPRKVS